MLGCEALGGIPAPVFYWQKKINGNWENVTVGNKVSSSSY